MLLSLRLMLLGTLLAASAGVATASDLITVPVGTSEVAVPVASGFDWSGFYAGVYGVVQSNPARGTELGAGIAAGVNAQFDFFLVGGEVALHGLTGDTIETAYGQVTGRGGLLVTEDLLAYASAGYGMELSGTGERDFLAGGGLEYAVTDDISVNAQYLRGFDLEGGNPKDQFSLGARFHF
ncbi:MAG TPA: porin family protein [Devosia sp.]|jgi:outer membrane immunogenic protein|uniref:outer membrane protein n=1 Tax=Devosia sp. TaxID=1871048 RepID=UPI002DDD3DDD|nr:porin family protein [Devosia sp.]HEV2518238.1 porin family protein [Devosia sp.]